MPCEESPCNGGHKVHFLLIHVHIEKNQYYMPCEESPCMVAIKFTFCLLVQQSMPLFFWLIYTRNLVVFMLFAHALVCLMFNNFATIELFFIPRSTTKQHGVPSVFGLLRFEHAEQHV